MTPKRDQLRLLPREAVITTCDVDQGAWNFHPLSGPLQRKRFQIVADLLPDRPSGRLLEIGYGSGVFMPELRRHCGALFGLDPHPRTDEVKVVLERHGIDVSLKRGSAESIPFDDSFFDVVVAVSAMEYVHDINQACIEIDRILASGGEFIFITPGHSRILDLAVWMLTGKSAEDQYGNRRQRLMEVHFQVFCRFQKGYLPSAFDSGHQDIHRVQITVKGRHVTDSSKRSLVVAVGFVFSGVFLWLAFRGTEFREVWESLRGADFRLTHSAGSSARGSRTGQRRFGGKFCCDPSVGQQQGGFSRR